MISLTFWPIRSGSSTCMLGNPSRNRMRSVKRSAWCISSIDSLRQTFAISSRPQLFRSDPERIEHLHVGKSVEEQDAVGEAVGVVHLFNRFLAPDLRHLQQAPIVPI